ncbi:hypothetical protein L3Y34_013747 [Caenorhabditis briggsae]|uniref:Uncharacterized protein n=1 Tax=Caenorhabditis briggsae TaxID=6238 RepID=A0AAE8ZXN6_CAEBR|nr:hypothetical protein L3Y34_013747 [Caenorhabditis briggsae]
MCTDTEDCLHHQRLRRQVSPPSTSSEAQAATSSSSSGFFVDLAACGRRTLAECPAWTTDKADQRKKLIENVERYFDPGFSFRGCYIFSLNDSICRL